MNKKIDVLRQIVKARESIRRKHLALKVGKEAAQHALKEVIQPISAPLEKIVKNLEQNPTIEPEPVKVKRRKFVKTALPSKHNDDFETAVSETDTDDRTALNHQDFKTIFFF